MAILTQRKFPEGPLSTRSNVQAPQFFQFSRRRHLLGLPRESSTGDCIIETSLARYSHHIFAHVGCQLPPSHIAEPFLACCPLLSARGNEFRPFIANAERESIKLARDSAHPWTCSSVQSFTPSFPISKYIRVISQRFVARIYWGKAICKSTSSEAYPHRCSSRYLCNFPTQFNKSLLYLRMTVFDLYLISIG